MRTVEPRNCNAFDQDHEKKGGSHGHLVHQTDDVVTAVGARWQRTQIADDQHAENEQRTMATEDVGKFVAQTGYDRLETAELRSSRGEIHRCTAQKPYGTIDAQSDDHEEEENRPQSRPVHQRDRMRIDDEDQFRA